MPYFQLLKSGQMKLLSENKPPEIFSPAATNSTII